MLNSTLFKSLLALTLAIGSAQAESYDIHCLAKTNGKMDWIILKESKTPIGIETLKSKPGQRKNPTEHEVKFTVQSRTKGDIHLTLTALLYRSETEILPGRVIKESVALLFSDVKLPNQEMTLSEFGNRVDPDAVQSGILVTDSFHTFSFNDTKETIVIGCSLNKYP